MSIPPPLPAALLRTASTLLLRDVMLLGVASTCVVRVQVKLRAPGDAAWTGVSDALWKLARAVVDSAASGLRAEVRRSLLCVHDVALLLRVVHALNV